MDWKGRDWNGIESGYFNFDCAERKKAAEEEKRAWGG